MSAGRRRHRSSNCPAGEPAAATWRRRSSAPDPGRLAMADSGAGDTILEVRELTKAFPVRRGVVLRRAVGHVQAVDGVSLALRRGRTLGLVGESGSGKSTVARMLVGVEKPTSGQVLIE